MQSPLPEDEACRLEQLRSYQILETPPEAAFDDLTRLAAFICGTPIALIGFIDADRQWFKAKVGWDVPEIPRGSSFCAETILQPDLVIVSDTLEAGKKQTCVLATRGGIRFYAGIALRTSEGYALGTLCVMDSIPRGLTEEQTGALQKLAGLVMAQLELRRRTISKPFPRSARELPPGEGSPHGDLPESEELFRAITEITTDAIIIIDENSKILFVNRGTEKIFGYPGEQLLGHELTMLMPDYLRHVHQQALKKYIENRKRHLCWESVELPGLHKNGAEVQLEVSFNESICNGKLIFAGICRDIAERKRWEERRWQMAAIVESSDDAILSKDLNGNITSWNRAAERIYGYSADEIMGKPVSILSPAERGAEIQQILEKLKRGERIENYQTVRISKSGEPIQMLVTVWPIRNEAGRIIGGSVIERHLTHRRQTEETLRAQEAQLRLLFERMPAVWWTTDAELRMTSSAGAGLAQLGPGRDRIAGISVEDYFQSDDPDSPPIAAHRQALQGKSVDCAITWKGRRFEARVEPLRDAEDRIIGCIGVALDVTRQRQAEEALLASKQHYRSVFEGVVQGAGRMSLDDRFLEVNPALAAMLGYDSARDLLELNAAEVYANQGERSRLLQKWLETQSIEEEADWKRRDGQIIRVRLSGRTLTDQRGLIQGFEFTAEDITERRDLEAQLRQAQKIEAVGQVAGDIAQELNNFLGIILGYSELMAGEIGENETLRRKLAEIRAATQCATSLSRQLLAFGRKQLLQPKAVDINQAIWEIHKLLRRLLPANIDVVPLLASGIGQVKVDPGQVQQILINLVVNARDAMPARGGKIVIETISVHLDEEYASQDVDLRPGSYVKLSVSDNGVGMDSETLSHIFEPFFTTKQAGERTGLGLSTIYGLVKQSGGDIAVESELGKGTQFHIYLPLAEAAKTNLTQQPSAAGPESETILVVEDEMALRRLICVALERRGYRVVAAKDGAEAAEILEQPHCRIHLVVSDIRMPRVDGLELMRRATTLRPSTKFLFTSGYSGTAEQPAMQGCAFLEKPFLPTELTSKVRQLLEEAAA